MMNKVLMNILEQNGGRILPFAELTAPAQASMVHYMAIDGEAWDLAPDLAAFFDGNGDLSQTSARVLSALPWYVKRYGKKKFGFAEVPTSELIRAWELISSERSSEECFDGFADYHRWYVDCGDTPMYPTIDMWPPIASSFDDELLQDGWHRFHSYCRSQVAAIPILYYPKR